MSVRYAVELPRDRIAPTLARDTVAARLGDLLSTRTLDHIRLVVSELVTNAVVHGVGKIELRMEFDGETVKGEVIDEGSGFEYDARQPAIFDVHGRGLFIVGLLTTRCGVRGGSTHVWFEIRLPEA